MWAELRPAYQHHSRVPRTSWFCLCGLSAGLSRGPHIPCFGICGAVAPEWRTSLAVQSVAPPTQFVPFAERSPIFSTRLFCRPGERELKGPGALGSAPGAAFALRGVRARVEGSPRAPPGRSHTSNTCSSVAIRGRLCLFTGDCLITHRCDPRPSYPNFNPPKLADRTMRGAVVFKRRHSDTILYRRTD